MTTPDEVHELAERARAAFRLTRDASVDERIGWLTAIAEVLEANRDELVELADAESRLGPVRLNGELSRTTGQLLAFAGAVREGSYREATIDHADPGATPPKPELRRMLIALGPVAVFSASNFPFAFSVAGGDTASALAAGCPVIVKGHSAHPRLSERTAQLVEEALRVAGAPDGVFAHVTGREAGTALVVEPAIQAVGFTGSLHGGRALFDLAVGRPDPIPFYGELSALNPVLVTEQAVAARADELADGLVASFTLGAGQFCTKPGVVLAPAGSGFADAVAARVGTDPAPMLSPGIADAFHSGLATLAAHRGVRAHGPAEQSGTDGRPVVLSVDADAVLADPDGLLVECFGPTTLVIDYRDQQQALAVVRAIGGSLTATVHAEDGEDLGEVVAELTAVAGRVLFAGWPTGVAVTWAQQHGGPWPSTTSLHTSVGATAMRRFLRPVAWQSAPASVLPPELRDENPLGIPRRVDGALQLA